MRKKTVTHVADTIFWYILYFLPIILTIVQSIGIFEQFGFENWEFINDNTSVSDYGFMNLLDANMSSFFVRNGNIIADVLSSIFGYGGILPMFSLGSPPIIQYFGYFVGVYLIHLCVDFILFIPRIAHKWLNKFTRECE